MSILGTRHGQRRRMMAVVGLCAGAAATCIVAFTPAVANADCTGAGDFGAGAGCPPPGDSSGSGGGESWPPTDVDWPPSQKSILEGSDGKGTPIVMPYGQSAPPPKPSSSASDSDDTSAPVTPIVPVGSASAVTTHAAGPSSTAIVTPSP